MSENNVLGIQTKNHLSTSQNQQLITGLFDAFPFEEV